MSDTKNTGNQNGNQVKGKGGSQSKESSSPIGESGLSHRFHENFSRFTGQAIPANRSAIVFDSITVDSRFATRWSTDVLSQQLDTEAIAEKMAKDSTRSEVEAALMQREVENVIRGLITIPLVTYGNTILTSKAVAAHCCTTFGSATGLVIAELLLAALEPAGMVDKTDKPYVLMSAHATLIPSYDAFMVDNVKREIDSFLRNSEQVVFPSGEKKIATGVLAERVASSMQQLGRTLSDVGLMNTKVDDLLLCIRAHIDITGTYRGVPRELRTHPVVATMARDVTFVGMAFQKKFGPNSRLTNPSWQLIEEFPQIAAFMSNSDRYERISLPDFRERFSLSVHSDARNSPKRGILALNMVGAPAPQVVRMWDESSPLESRVFKEHREATQHIGMMYGDVLNHISSYSCLRVLGGLLSNLTLVQKDMEPGMMYLWGGAMLSAEDKATVLTALAASVATSVHLSVTEGGVCFSYLIPLNGVNYDPISGAREFESALLTDPAEVLLLYKSWEGTRAMTDRQQILPKALIEEASFMGIQARDLLDFSVSHSVNLKLDDVNLRSSMDPATLMGVKLASVYTVVPLLNSWLGRQWADVMILALDGAMTAKDKMMQLGLKRQVFGHVLQVPEKLSPLYVGKVVREIKILLTQAATGSEHHVEGVLMSSMAEKLIALQASDFIFRRLGLQAGNGAFAAVLSDSDFGYYFGTVVQ